MTIHLVAAQAFGPHAKGDKITDPIEIAAILASDHSGHVLPVETSTATPQEA